MILSHHGKEEHVAVREPQTIEAMALYLLNETSGKLNHVQQQLDGRFRGLRLDFLAQNHVRRIVTVGGGNDALRQNRFHRTKWPTACAAAVKFRHTAFCQKTKPPSKLIRPRQQ